MIKEKRVYYFDYLKVVASIMVIMIHSSAPSLLKDLRGANIPFF